MRSKEKKIEINFETHKYKPKLNFETSRYKQKSVLERTNLPNLQRSGKESPFT